MTCSNCGAEVADGMKFCFDCGTPVPQVKKCVSCGAELSLKMKFCPECGAKQDGSAPKSSGFSMGDKNVIAGDVIGSKEETNISGNATIIKNEDQTKQVKKCHICGSFVSILDGYNCPECGEFTCEDCFDLSKRICKSCEKNKLQNNEEKFIEALKEFLKDGIIDANERREIESLKVKYGISTEKANALEQELKPKTEKINFSTIEKLNLTEATEVFYEQGNAKKSYELLEPIYKAHSYSEEVLNIYLPVLIKTDIEEAKKIVSKSNIDILSMYMAEIEIAIIEKDLDLAERKLKQAKQLWQSNKLKYYEAWFYLELAKSTGKDTFVSNAEEIANNFDKTEDKLELSYQIKILKNIAEYKGKDTSFYTKAFCKENNLYTSVVLGVNVKKIIVGKNQQIKSLNEALELIIEDGTVILEPGIYKEHVNFDKKIKIVGLTDSIMNKSSSELPIIVLDETKTCKITADVEIEGVVFTHEEKLSFNNLQNYADTKYNFDKDIKSKDYRDVDFASCLLVNSDAKLKNVAILDSLTYGITLGRKGTIEDSIISHCYANCLYCVKKTEATVQKTKIINSKDDGVLVEYYSNPYLKDCEIYGHLVSGIWVINQAKGTYTNCHIHDNEDNGLDIEGSATPSFEDCHIHDNKQNGLDIEGSSTPSFVNCKIHDNKIEGKYYQGVVVKESSNPSIKDCEIYGHLECGIWVKDQASGTYTNCHIHDNQTTGLCIGGSSTPSFEDCKIHDNKPEVKKYPNPGVTVRDSSNPSIKDCEIYGHLDCGIWVDEQASGVYANCHIHDNEDSGLVIKGSATPSFEDCHIHDNQGNGLKIGRSSTPSFVNCKIHDNKIEGKNYPGVVVRESSNPIIKDCEIYGHLECGIWVKDQAKGTYKNCYLHNNKNTNFSNETSNTIDTSTCRME